MENCKAIDLLECSIQNIIERITPIQYTDNVLHIESPLSVNPSLIINNVALDGNNGVLELPEGTNVGGVSLLSPHNINGAYELPPKTEISGYKVLSTHYFYFFTSTTRPFSLSFTNGGFINNYGQNDGTYPGNYPFLVPNDCVLTSLRFSLVVLAVVGGGSPSSTITNATATIYTVSLSGVQTNTGVSVTIPASPLPSRNYAETTFSYPVTKGTSIGVRVQYTGTVSSEVGVSAFAVLGYNYQ